MFEIKTDFYTIGENHPTYIIAEIGSNFDGSLKKAKQMIDLAVSVGANCAKFQTFKPNKIISEAGFGKAKQSFQAKWKKSVYQVYSDAMLPREWHVELYDYCKKKRIDFASSPYDVEAVDLLLSLRVPYFKIGSGEVANLEFIEYVAKKKRPMIVAVGASTLAEIDEMMAVIRKTKNQKIMLLQCVTNYPSPFSDANIRVVQTLRQAFETLVGYSDHTPGHTVPLGAVALGAKVIEKHFTDDKTNSGPDHPFALDPVEFKQMTDEIRNLEAALGSGVKVIYPAEAETQVLQRRSLYTTQQINKGQKITKHMVDALRPAKGLLPKYKSLIVGKIAQRDIEADQPIDWDLITRS